MLASLVCVERGFRNASKLVIMMDVFFRMVSELSYALEISGAEQKASQRNRNQQQHLCASD